MFPKGSIPQLPLCGLPVWIKGIEKEEMGQTYSSTFMLSFRQSLESPQRDIFKHTVEFSGKKKMEFNHWSETNVLWEVSRILYCVFKCRQDFPQTDATFSYKSVSKWLGLTPLNICKTSTTISCHKSRNPDKGNVAIHRQFLIHWLHANIKESLINKSLFYLLLFTNTQFKKYFCL